jgi:hypothetical protein
MRRPTLILVILSICLLTPALTAQQRGFGLGVMLGEPTGISAKLWLGQTTALDGVVAWSFVNNPAISVHADYLFHFFDVFSVKAGTVALYAGIGGMVSFGPDPDVGVRIPFGSAYLFESVPLDIFLEIAPIFLLIPATTFDFSGGLGVRFYFPSKSRANR